MEFIYIIIGLIILGYISQYIKKRNEAGSPYYRIQRKLEEDLLKVNLTSDYSKKQEINLHLLWLKTIKEIECSDFLGRKKDDSNSAILSKIGEERLKFPLNWSLENHSHLAFSEAIIGAFTQVLESNEYEGWYKPNFALPVPNVFIKKALLYKIDFLALKGSDVGLELDEDLPSALRTLISSLNYCFVDTSGKDLPQKDIVENTRQGRLFYDSQEESEDKGELALIDWLNEEEWLKKGETYTKEEEYTRAVLCFERCLSKNPKNIHALQGIGRCSCKLKEYAKSVEYFERALALQPNDEATLMNVANSSFYIGDTERYFSCYDRIIKMNPENGTAYYNIAFLHGALGHKQLERVFMWKAARYGVEKARLWVTEKGAINTK